MTPYIDPLLQDKRATNVYERAIEILRSIKNYSFEDAPKAEDGGHIMNIDAGTKSGLAIDLVCAAALMTGTVDADADEENGTLELFFPSTYDKPPVLQMRAKLDALTSYLFNDCVIKDPESENIFIQNPGDHPFDSVYFAYRFIEEGEPFQLFYRLPEGMEFTGSDNKTYTDQDLVSLEVLHHYLEEHSPETAKKLAEGDIPPAAICIAPETLQHMYDEFGMTPAKHRFAIN